MIAREQIEAIRAAMVAPLVYACIVSLLLAVLVPLGKRCRAELRSMAAACREGGLRKFGQYLFVGWCVSVAMYVSAVKPGDPSSHCAPQRAPAHRVVEHDSGNDGCDPREAVTVLDPQLNDLDGVEGFRIVEYAYTNRIMDVMCAWESGTNDASGICLFANYGSIQNMERYGYSANSWLAGIDVSGMSHWNGWMSKWQAGTAITRRHVLFARHYMYSSTGMIYFTDMSGVSYGAQILATNALENADFTVAVLDRDIPFQITPLRILPEDYRAYVGNCVGLPVVTFNQREQASVSDWYCRTEMGSTCRESVSGLRHKEFVPLVSGDSGDPAFLVLGNEPILVHTLTFGGAGGGPFTTYYAEDLQRACDTLSVLQGLDPLDYQIQKVDLSGFTALPMFQGD